MSRLRMPGARYRTSQTGPCSQVLAPSSVCTAAEGPSLGRAHASHACIHLGLFASNANPKVQGALNSKYHQACPGSRGVDAMLHPWAWSLRDEHGNRLMVFITGPFHPIWFTSYAYGRSWIRDEQLGCILIAPAWPAHVLAMLHATLCKQAVELHDVPDLFHSGPHASGRKPQHYRHIL